MACTPGTQDEVTDETQQEKYDISDKKYFLWLAIDLDINSSKDKRVYIYRQAHYYIDWVDISWTFGAISQIVGKFTQHSLSIAIREIATCNGGNNAPWKIVSVGLCNEARVRARTSTRMIFRGVLNTYRRNCEQVFSAMCFRR